MASAGSGKSTLLLQCVTRCQPGSRVVLLTYNKPLAVELQQKLSALRMSGILKDDVVADVYTFHGLCSTLFQLTPDDCTMEVVLNSVIAGQMSKRIEFDPTHVCVDECQDLRPLHHLLIQVVMPARPVYLLVGDENQLLYAFEDPPATTDYMKTPSMFFGGEKTEWEHRQLTVSFRLHEMNASLANSVSVQMGTRQLRYGNACAGPVRPRVQTVSVWRWGTEVSKLLERLTKTYTYDQVAVISPSVRNCAPLLAMVNALAMRRVPMYIHGVDGSDERVRKGKLGIMTWHASKGLEWDCVVAIGVSATAEANPLHVALTRAKREIVVVNDLKSPCVQLLRAVSECPHASCDAKTAELASRVEAIPPLDISRGCGPKDLSQWTARGGLAYKLHASILDAGGVDPIAGDSVCADLLAQVGDLWEDVTHLYVTAALMAMEHEVTGRVRYMDDMTIPIRTTREERTQRTMSGDRSRFVDMRCSDEDLMPTVVQTGLWSTLREGPGTTPSRRDATVYASAAVAASCFNTFHHKCRRLHNGEWIQPVLFDEMLRRAMGSLPNIKDTLVFDTICARQPELDGERPLHVRVHVLDVRVGCAYHFTHADRITTSTRLRAVLPLALNVSIRTARIVNLRTGEIQNLALQNRVSFLSSLHD
jgi:hypothetical protein